jgi:dephospho-CoA kinase
LADTLPQRPLSIGLTGGIGSGKSTVAAMLVELGCVLIDTDAIARSLTAAGGHAIAALRTAFGDAVIGADGALDRAAMRERVFNDAATKQRLEALLHPLILHECAAQAAAAGDRARVFDVPLLAESGHWRARVDRVLVVDCSEATQVERVMQRSGWPRATVERVIAQQATREQRRAIADAVIVNDHGLSLARLRHEVAAVLAQWQATPDRP